MNLNLRIAISVCLIFMASAHSFSQLSLPRPTLTVSFTGNTSEATVSQAGGFKITRSGSAIPLTVRYTVSGTAVAGRDYQTLSGSVSLPSGSTTAFIKVVAIDDGEFEGNETVVLTLSPSASYTLGSASSATVTIADNDTLTLTIGVPGNAVRGGQSGTGTVTSSTPVTVVLTSSNPQVLRFGTVFATGTASTQLNLASNILFRVVGATVTENTVVNIIATVGGNRVASQAITVLKPLP